MMGYTEDEALALYLQQQENAAGYVFGDSEADVSDDEWGRPKKRKGGKTKASGRGKKGKANDTSIKKSGSSKKNAAKPSGTDENAGLNEEGAEKKSKKPVKWSEEEERLFLEGLELYGREWDKLAAHIGHGRDKNACKSHAQKHFIKLYITNKTLPDKVKESGDGYTLSGRPLDPDSAALMAYSNQPGYRQRLKAEADAKKAAGCLERNAANANKVAEGAVVAKLEPAAKPAASKGNQKAAKDNTKENAKQSKPPAKRKVTFKPASETTEYAANRPKRTKTAFAEGPMYIGEENAAKDPLALIQCHHYGGVAGSGDAKAQPFRLLTSPVAMVTMDFHAHLARSEVIGFLAGNWDEESKGRSVDTDVANTNMNIAVLRVERAFPCREMAAEDEDVSLETQVEMDPESEFEVRERISALNLQVVGWYHSHPSFKPIPSNRDVDNQHNYQVLFKESDSSAEMSPFVGAIVGPFDTDMPNEHSVINWFHVRKVAHLGCEMPLVLTTDQDYSRDMALADLHKNLEAAVEDMIALVDYYSTFEHRVEDFKEIWRFCQRRENDGLVDTGKPGDEPDATMTVSDGEGGVVEMPKDAIARSLIDKLRLSLLSRVNGEEAGVKVIGDALDYLMSVWHSE